MDDVVIRAEGLSKRYRIRSRQARYRTLREAILEVATAPARWLRTARRGSAVTDGGDDEIWALEDVSFEVRQGEAIGIIGRNGAGKSTLLKVLSRITEPTRGRVRVAGRVGSLLEIGTGFHNELTGRENIFLNGAILGMRRSEIQRRFDEIVAFAEVEKFLDTAVKHYSSGMYMRLAFAVAAYLDPEILLVDEVLAVGDIEFQKKCLGRMGDIAHTGRTVLFVSHNMASIANLCSRALLLERGRLVAEGPAQGVVQQYLEMARSAEGEVRWADPSTAPGDDIVRLHSVGVLQDEAVGPVPDVDIAREVIIEISYWCLREGSALYSAIWLRDKMGAFVLSSSNHAGVSSLEDPWSGRPHPVGLYRSQCRIPGNFLNDGLYTITAILGRGSSDTRVLQDYALSFVVHDSGEMRKQYFGEWIGAVRPKLAWQTARADTSVCEEDG